MALVLFTQRAFTSDRDSGPSGTFVDRPGSDTGRRLRIKPCQSSRP